MDEVCQIFSANFYDYLLSGNTILGSFNKAQNLVDSLPKNYEICCCAHKHEDDCVWYKFYKEDRKAAHALHAKKDCSCSKKQARMHESYCSDYRKFKKFFDE